MMNEENQQKNHLSLFKRALLTIERLQAKISALEQTKTEPIAIIGMSCRFPGGANSPEQFWRLLCEDVDTCTSIPAERWDRETLYDPDPAAPGKMCTRYGSFLQDIDQFDPYFFGISPREAISIDPQQRLLLEVAWEALDNAGQVLDQLRESLTGVFVGIMSKDYAKLSDQKDGYTGIDAYYCTGNDFSFASGRLSYTFGLRGPSIALDTACSSSLVAVHLACQSLRAGECQMALAGGVSLMLSPELHIFLSKAGALSPDGHCKAFDASANGMGRGEGCGVIVLKRLSDALSHGDPILAVIRGSATNHDGPSGGLTVPSGLAQEAVLTQALANAQLSSEQVEYIEAHGTGTILGDPIEIQALGAVFGQGHSPEHPLIVGSVKTNIGHLDSAAGIAGLIKTVLMLQHREIPRHLHFKQPNSFIAWEQLPIKIPTEKMAWETITTSRTAGISSFGLSGINAHVIVQEFIPPMPTNVAVQIDQSSSIYLLPLSAHTTASLQQLAQSYQHYLREQEMLLPSICYTASLRRTHHEYRLALVGQSPSEILEQLNAYLHGTRLHNLAIGNGAPEIRPPIVFVFSGQGAQWIGMGRQLSSQYKVFHQALKECDHLFQQYAQWSLLDELVADEEQSRFEETEIAQPLLFAFQVALTRLWHSWGIIPDIVIGHSVGEVAAAHVAGILTLADAIKIVFHRSHLMRQASNQGQMAVIHLSSSELEAKLATYDDHRLSIAAINNPFATVITGDVQALNNLLEELDKRNISYQRIPVSYAFHSHQMEPFKKALIQALSTISPQPGHTQMISTVTGKPCDWQQLDANYWGQNMRDPVRFAAAIQALPADEAYTFLEISPHAVLTRDIDQCLTAYQRQGFVIPSLRKNQHEQKMLYLALGKLYCLGYPMPWQQLNPGKYQCVNLPSYSWQRERFWLANYKSLPAQTAISSSLSGTSLVDRQLEEATPPQQQVATQLTPKQIYLAAEATEQPRLLEQFIRSLAANVLGFNETRLNVNTSLQKMGMDSLLAIELKNVLEQEWGVSLNLTSLLQGMSVTQICNCITEKLQKDNMDLLKRKTSSPVVNQGNGPIVLPLAQKTYIPLAPAQQRLWLLDQLYPNSAMYNEFMALRLQGTVDLSTLEWSINEIVRRHEILRTTFHMQEGQPIQRIHDWKLIPIQVHQLTHVSPEQRESQAAKFLEEEVRKPFQLDRGPLLRVHLVKLGDHEYILVLLFHHIIIDAWSAGIFYEELGHLYNAFLQGTQAPLAKLPLQYADFAIWQHQQFQGEDFVRQVDYWRQQLAGAPTTLDLPFSCSRPARQTYQGAHYTFRLPATLSQQLLDLSLQEGVTLFMTLLSAFQVLLYRYTHQEDLLIGVPIAQRNHLHLEKLIGFFINTVVLRADLSGNPTFRELLTRVRQVTLDAYAHQDVPFEHLVAIMQQERDPSRSPLFQVMFVMEKDSWSQATLTGVELSPYELESGHAIFDLVLSMTAHEHELQGSLEYNTALFTHEAAKNIVQHFLLLLEQITIDPEKHIDTFSLITETEQQLLQQWNQTEMPSAPEICLQWYFEEQVERNPEVIAVADQEQCLTYEKINRRANQLAHYLQQVYKIGPDIPVGLYMERSIDLYIALLAILKAGGAYVPLDPTYPMQRLSYMLKDAQVAVVLTQSHLRASLPHSSCPILVLDKSEKIAAQPEHNPAFSGNQANLAYIIYTSGSTGQPKGIAMPHASLINLLSWQRLHSKSTNHSRTLQFTSISFDVAFQELFSTWCSGGTLILVTEEVRKDVRQLLRYMATIGIERLFLPFVALQQLAITSETTEPVQLVLSEIMTAGEQLQVTPSLRKFFQQSPATKLINQYGPAETHVVTAYTLPSDPNEWDLLPSIGQPIANTQVHILDDYLQPVPIGSIGEIYLGGQGVARGYQGNPALTAERFIPDHLGTRPGMRLYRTGDRARYRRDGSIEFLGRLDNQIKLRGFRIEPGEIEAVLVQYPAISEAIVTLREDLAQDKQLVAYIVRQPGNLVTGSELRQHMQQFLPDYMLPTFFVFLDTLPLTPSGKVDRRALPVPDRAQPEVDKLHRAPRTPIEETLTHIFEQVLSLHQVRIDDNFFEIGGHSLLATQIMTRISETFHLDLPVRYVFDAPTIVQLASILEQALYTQSHVSTLPLVHIPQQTRYPLSFAQKRLWFLDQLEPSNIAYVLPLVALIEGKLEREILQKSMQEIVRRHEILRTRFMLEDMQPYQAITPHSMITIPWVDLTELPAEQQNVQVQQLIQQTIHNHFDLVNDQLLRISVIQLHEEEYLLVLIMHHIISDGWSTSIFFQELATLYEAFTHQLPSPLPELTIQYGDFAIWQQEWLRRDVLTRQRNYWLQQLADLPNSIDLPLDRPRPRAQTYRGAHLEFTFTASLAEALYHLSRQEGVTLYMLLLAAFQILLYRYTGQEDIVVGTPVSIRNRKELEHLIGFFTNTLVMRSQLSGNPGFRDFLQQVKETCLDAFTHQDFPFEQLVEALQPQRDLSRSPLFQILFTLQNTPAMPLHLGNAKLRPFPIEPGTAKFDLALEIIEEGNTLHGRLEYNTDLFTEATMQRFLQHWQGLLTSIAHHLETKVALLPFLPTTEQHTLLTVWNNTARAYPQSACLHELVEAQVKQTPDAIAVVVDDISLTYHELHQRALQLALYLQEQGVQPDVLVGICMERSLEMVIGLLGILLAGGAYVPLDPEYPTERLSFILHDAQVTILLTQAKFANETIKLKAHCLCLDTDWGHISTCAHKTLERKVQMANLAYLIYTSGSTGTPKGAMNTHQAVTNRLCWMQESYQLTSQDRVLQKTPFSFDVSVWEFFWPLLSGASLVMACPGGHKDSAYLADLLQREQITTLHFVPSMLQVFLEEPRLQHYPALKRVICSGEALSPELQQRFFACMETTALYNLYGPTEAAIDVSHWTCKHESEQLTTVPIGYPIANIQLYVLDKYLQPMPIGCSGELYIGGIGVGRGYHQRPDLTAEKFLPDPFSQQPGARLYKTGDLARYTTGGILEYLGRTDFQVKIRGFRIELGEIEALLLRHSDIRECVVCAREESSGHKHLVAYLVPRKQKDNPSQEYLRQYLKDNLPDYMLPSAFVWLETLPLTPNGKLDRKALPIPEWVRSSIESSYAAPQTEHERLLVSIWEKVLGIKQIGIHDNFFALGGDSILSMQVVARAHQQGLNITPKQLFQHQTIAELCAVATVLPSFQIEQVPVLGEVPLTPIQHWFFSQHFTYSHHWNQSIVLQVQTELDMHALQKALADLCIHHDALRTRFTMNGTEWQQMIIPPEDTLLPLTWFDLTILSAPEQDRAMRTIEAHIQGYLDLTKGPLAQIVYFSLGSTQPDRLLLIVHHLIVDGVSWRILLPDLYHLYQHYSQGLPEHLPAKTTSIKRWSELLQEYAQSERIKSEFAYWKAESRRQVLPLPIDFVYQDEHNTLASTQTISLALTDQETRELLITVPTAYHTQINDVLITALVRTIANWTRSNLVLIDLEGHGREDLIDNVLLTRTVGWFTTLFPLCINITPTTSLLGSLQHIKEQLRQLPEHGIGYGLLRYLHEDATVREELQQLPQAQILFNYLGQFDQLFDQHVPFSNLVRSPGPERHPNEKRTHLLEITCWTSQGQLQIDWIYSTAIHARATIEQLAQTFVAYLRALIRESQERSERMYIPSDFTDVQLSQDQLDQILEEVDID